MALILCQYVLWGKIFLMMGGHLSIRAKQKKDLTSSHLWNLSVIIQRLIRGLRFGVWVISLMDWHAVRSFAQLCYATT